MNKKANELTNGKMTKGELDNLLRAFRLNTKAAKTSIVNIWAKQYQGLLLEHKKRQARVNKRSAERGIPERFRPKLYPPNWSYGGDQCYEKLRPGLRRLAHAQIDAIVKSRLE